MSSEEMIFYHSYLIDTEAVRYASDTAQDATKDANKTMLNQDCRELNCSRYTVSVFAADPNYCTVRFYKK